MEASAFVNGVKSDAYGCSGGTETRLCSCNSTLQLLCIWMKKLMRDDGCENLGGKDRIRTIIHKIMFA